MKLRNAHHNKRKVKLGLKSQTNEQVMVIILFVSSQLNETVTGITFALVIMKHSRM